VTAASRQQVCWLPPGQIGSSAGRVLLSSRFARKIRAPPAPVVLMSRSIHVARSTWLPLSTCYVEARLDESGREMRRCRPPNGGDYEKNVHQACKPAVRNVMKAVILGVIVLMGISGAAHAGKVGRFSDPDPPSTSAAPQSSGSYGNNGSTGGGYPQQGEVHNRLPLMHFDPPPQPKKQTGR
jgi:hypothetical protein